MIRKEKHEGKPTDEEGEETEEEERPRQPRL
jgi:hypothetical protein